MSNNNKIAIISIVVVLAVVSVIVALNSQKNDVAPVVNENTDVVTEMENQVSDINAALLEETNAPVVSPEELSMQEEEAAEVAKEMIVEATQDNFTIEFMTTAEKEAMGIDPALKVQVLARDPSGTILGYKFISSDEDIVESVDNLEL